MARKQPDRPRTRPGRRPPNRSSAGSSSGTPKRRGFTGAGYRQLYGWLMPGLAGEEKRHFFNEVSGGVVLAAGLIGAGVGFACLGWIGGVLGLVVGITAGGSYVEEQRYYRR